MRLFVNSHTDGAAINVFIFIVLWLIGSIGFTNWWKRDTYAMPCTIATIVMFGLMRHIAHGPSARHLPDNASAPSDFKQRPLNARPYAGKVAVLTGGTSGIGFETLKSLCFLGAHVVIVDMVDEKAAEAAQKKVLADDKHASMAYVKLNLANLDEIADAAGEIVQAACKLRKMTVSNKAQCIDFLVNNAGCADPKRNFNDYGTLGFVVNYFGPYLLTEHLLPHIVDKTGRIVNLASVAHSWWFNYPRSLDAQYRVVKMLEDVNDASVVPYPSNDAYAASKYANLLHACTLAKRLEKRGVTTASVHPGAVFSGIWNFISYPLKYVTDFMMTLFFKDCYMGHQTTLHCITAGNIVSGGYYADCHLARPRDEARDEKNWQAVEEWTREKVKQFLPK